MIARTLIATLLLTPGIAFAQARECRLPSALPRPAQEGPSAREPRRVQPVGGYTLALSWSPEYCRQRTDNPRDSIQCGGAADHFGFTLHGLWPDGRDRKWPQYCRPASLLPERVLRANLCAMPSVQLMQHEWAKHGTCLPGATPDGYFRAATMLYRAVRFPDMDRLAMRRDLTVGAFARAFAAANRGMNADMIRVSVNPRGWLTEVGVCLGTDMRLARCAAHRRGAPDSMRIRIEDGR